MSRITHIFFDLHGTLIDSHRLHPCYTQGLAELMTARYGGSPELWREANRRIVADWDSYYADLDLGGEDGIDHMWEGLFRVTRALFRLADIPEPPKAELTALSKEIPAVAPRKCDALFPDAKPVLKRLHESGYTLGIASHALKEQARSLLIGAGVNTYFTGKLLTPDVTGHFKKEADFLRHALIETPSSALLVDDDPFALKQARQLGWHTAHITREHLTRPSPAEVHFENGLSGLDSWVLGESIW